MVALVLLVYLALSLCAAVAAQRKGRDFGVWWLYALALLPVALPHALTVAPDRAGLERQQLAQGRRKCPHCAEMIWDDATVCRYCARDVPLGQHGAPTAPSPVRQTPLQASVAAQVRQSSRRP